MFQALFSWQFLLFCLAIAAIIFVIRRFAEYAMENWASAAKESKLWKELILPILPVLIGPVAAFFAKKYPFPDGLNSISARIAFGLVAGLLSGLVYRVLKSMLSYKAANPSETTAQAAGSAMGAIGTPDAPLSDDDEAKVRDSIRKDQ
jgi:hypothetical protein